MLLDDRIQAAATPLSSRLAATHDFACKAARSLAPMFGASRAVFSSRHTGAGAIHFINWPAWCQSHYCRHVRDQDPIRDWLDAPGAGRHPNVARLSDLPPKPTCRQAPFADRLMRESGAGFVMTIALRDGLRVIGALSLVRDIGAEDFNRVDCDLAQAFSPMLDLAYRGAVTGLLSVRMPASPGVDLRAVLTPREYEVAVLAAAGHHNKAIARMLDASPWTIKNHLRAVFRKTGVHNRTELARALD